MTDIAAHSEFRLVEPLSNRERDILALLAENLSDREIADRLVIGYTTVKWYNRQIFGKLGAENRKAAVQRARALGLFDSTAPTLTPNHNLPSHLTPFIGRSKELDDLSRWLGQPHPRLVTILAPGGMGKTRLALEAAEGALPHFPDGVFFVSLAPIASDDHVLTAIAEACGLTFSPDGRSPKQQLLDFLRHKRLLLVLDNFEHLLDSAPLVTEMLSAAPQVKAMVTSRERLNLSGEVVYPLAGLNYPEQPNEDGLLRYGAVQLFIECALRANPRFSSDDVTTIGVICRMVQGMPLAIELAGAWAGSLSPAEIAAEIERSADFLSTTMRDVPERLRSVRAVFEAAWARLTNDEQRTFRRLSVFRGGCTREAAQEVTGADVSILSALVDKALLWRNAQTGRYDIHELLRQYAEQELKAVGEDQSTRQAHQAYFGQFSYRWNMALRGGDQLQTLAILDADMDNIRKAFDSAIEQGTPDALESFTEIWFYYQIRAWWVEGHALFDRAIKKLGPHDSVALARLLTLWTWFRGVLGLRSSEQYVETTGRSVEIQRHLGVKHLWVVSLYQYANALHIVGRLEESLSIFREGYEMARQAHDRWLEAVFLRGFGLRALHEGQHEQAREYLSQTYQLMNDMGNHWGMCIPLADLGRLAFDIGEYEATERYFTESLSNARSIHFLGGIEEAKVGLGYVAWKKGDHHLAYTLAEEVLKMRQQSGVWDVICSTFAFMAYMALGKDDIWDAKRCIRKGLAVAEESDEGGRLYFLMMAASVLMEIGETRQAACLLTLAKQITEKPRWISVELELLDQLWQSCREALSPDDFAAAYERGKALTIEAALALVSAAI